MSLPSTKLKAYTLLEMLFTLLIASFVIIFMISLYLFIDKQMQEYSRASSSLLHEMVFDDVIRKDLQEAQRLEIKEGKLYCYTYDQQTIAYHIASDTLRRELNTLQTSLDIPCKEVQLERTSLGAREVLTLRFLRPDSTARVYYKYNVAPKPF